MPRWVDAFRQWPRLILFLAILWTILIFIACSLPGKDLPAVNVFDQFDKVVHFLFFLVFGILWGIVSNKHFIILFFAVCFGFGIEYYQYYFVAGRSFDVWDGVADSLGAMTASFMFLSGKQGRL